ncbi:hypothetical protein F5B19DRAFT_110340 [Rostrohypoxylon terebratum]|nr:hypothetical protein F5B19DRAFT_110340 [Rostrohypoxylon terebratum]
MGNQNSKEVKAEEDGEEEKLGSSPSWSQNASRHPSPDIVYSSQVHASTPMNRSKPTTTSNEYLTNQRHPIPAFDRNLPQTSPTIAGMKHEVPSSPDHKKKISTPNNRSNFKVEKRSSDSPILPPPRLPITTPHAPSNLNPIRSNGKYTSDLPSQGEQLSYSAKKRRRQKKKEKRRLQQLASSDLGNNQEHPTSSLHSGHDAIVDPTPSKHRSSKRQKTETPGSQPRKKKKRKHRHDKGDSASNAIPFSSLAESLYADHRKNGKLRVDKESVQNDTAPEQPPDDFGREPSLPPQSISYIDTNHIDLDPESATHDPDVASDDEMKVEPVEDDSRSYDGRQPNGSGDERDNDDLASEAGQSASQGHGHQDEEEYEEQDERDKEREPDRMDIDEDDQSNYKSKINEGVNESEKNENMRTDVESDSKSLADIDATNDEYRPDDEEEAESSVSNIEEHHKPKNHSARKRVVKPTFFERLAEESFIDTKVQPSPPIAGPSRPAEKKQAKISTMLKGKAVDRPTPGTSTPKASAPKASAPKTPSQKRSIPPKTPKTGPHELTTGPFSDFELRNITQAVEHWRADHNLTQTQVNTLIQGNPKEVHSQEFWACIVAACPNRARQKVINQCRRKFHNFVARGTWTEEQQEELERIWKQHGNKYALIGKIINRHPEDVRDRVRNYAICGDNRRSDPWTLDEEEKLQAIISEALQAIREQRRLGKIRVQEADEELIDWQRVSELMDRTRSRLQCIQKWKIINRHGPNRGSIDGDEVMSVDQMIQKARDEADAMSNRDRFSIVKAVDASGVKADSRIPWAKVRSLHLEDRWTRPTIMLAWYRLRHSVPDWNIMTIPEITIQLGKKYRETRKLEYPSGRSYDISMEYSDMEHKIQKILKIHRAPKTPNRVIMTDDDDSGDEGSSEEAEEAQETEESNEDDQTDKDEDEGEDEVNQKSDHVSEDNNRQEEDIESKGPSDNDSKDEDVSMANGTDESLRGSVDLGNDENKSLNREPSADAPSSTEISPQRVRQSQKRNSTIFKSTISQRRFQRKRRPIREVIEESSQEEVQAPNDDELSSDTNASEVESIPARL